ncbi:MAG: orotidine-5'-phosphate decarboxylase [Elusimicrobiota bacterium]|jgi:orotidine-5'-phosphate decarboxylase
MSKTQMKPLIVALDVETDREALALVRRLRLPAGQAGPQVDLFKVGPILFLKYGGALLKAIRSEGAEIFLDLKFHDIPSVVRKSVERAAEWGVYSATIHASGGAAMMREAAAASPRPKLWGVTVLTSLDQKDLQALGVSGGVTEQVQRLAKLAAHAGLDGVIASVREAAGIKAACGKDFQVVTPGIRLGATADDQKRTQTPVQAVQAGADFFVMGRPILEAADPVKAVEQIYQSI